MNHPNNIKSVDMFYVLDFDRCLGRTEKFQVLLEEAVEREGIVDLDMIQYAHSEVKKTGGSFDTAAYVRQVLKDRKLDVNRIWGKIEADFVAAAQKEDVFEPGARQLLETLKKRRVHYGIVTFGGFDWQTAKLRAAGLQERPYVITSYKEKGHMIASWQQDDGRFLIPEELNFGEPLLAKHVVLVDDKPISFDGVPPEVIGLCVAPRTSEVQTAALPPNVQIVQDMKQVSAALFDAKNY